MKELELDRKDREARMEDDDRKLKRFIDKHRELMAGDDAESKKVIDKIVQTREHVAEVTSSSPPASASGAKKPLEPFAVEGSKPLREELDPTLKKKIKQSRNELADRKSVV